MTDYLTTDGPAICLLLHRIMSTESVGRPRGHAFLINRCRWLAPVMRDAPPFPRPRWRSIKTLLLTFLAGDWDSALLVDVARRGRGTQTDLLLNNAFTASHSTTGGVLFFAGICLFVCYNITYKPSCRYEAFTIDRQCLCDHALDFIFIFIHWKKR